MLATVKNILTSDRNYITELVRRGGGGLVVVVVWGFGV
jgi:hypothetical protein